MSRKLALKKLKPSDLTYFRSYFFNEKKVGTTRQKAFNLDSKVMQDARFFPGLKQRLIDLKEQTKEKGVLVSLVLFGPELGPALPTPRLLQVSKKNIRLSGVFVKDPPGQEGRFKDLRPGDFAVLEFTGEGEGFPATVKAVLVSATASKDAKLHDALLKLLPKPTNSMRVLDEAQLRGAVVQAGLDVAHPLNDWLDDALHEAAVEVSPEAILQLNVRRSGRVASPDDFKDSLAAAALTGEQGEKLMDQWLSGTGQGVTSHEWVSITNAIAPFDFRIEQAGLTREADAKSTSGKFETLLYLSSSEICYATSSELPYDIYRLFDVKATGARMRVAHDVREKLKPVQAFIVACPDGAQVDSLAFKPDFFDFDPAVHVIEAQD